MSIESTQFDDIESKFNENATVCSNIAQHFEGSFKKQRRPLPKNFSHKSLQGLLGSTQIQDQMIH